MFDLFVLSLFVQKSNDSYYTFYPFWSYYLLCDIFHYNLPLYGDFDHIIYHVTFHYNLPLYVEWMGWGDDGNFHIKNTFGYYKTRTRSSTLSARCVSTYFYFVWDFIGHRDGFVTRFIFEKRGIHKITFYHILRYFLLFYI